MSCCGGLKPVVLASEVIPITPIQTPLEIMAGNIIAGWDAADLAASPVALWPDASGNGFDLIQAVGANQPTWNANTGSNSQPAVLFDGINDAMVAALSLPQPGTTPTFYWVIFRHVTWTLNDAFWSTSGASLFIGQSPTTPQLVQGAPTLVNANSGMPVNTYRRLEALFNNATSDYLKLGSTSVTGANAGNAVSGATWSLGNNGNIQVCEFWIFNILPNATELAALNLYAADRYGSDVLA